MLLDERDGFAAKGIGEIFFFIDLGSLPRRIGGPSAWKVRMCTAEETEELVEATPLRMEPFAAAQMPLADEAQSHNRPLLTDRRSSFPTAANQTAAASACRRSFCLFCRLLPEVLPCLSPAAHVVACSLLPGLNS